MRPLPLYRAVYGRQSARMARSGSAGIPCRRERQVALEGSTRELRLISLVQGSQLGGHHGQHRPEPVCVGIGMARRTPSDKIAALRASYKEARDALALIREMVEELAPSGRLPSGAP